MYFQKFRFCAHLLFAAPSLVFAQASTAPPAPTPAPPTSLIFVPYDKMIGPAFGRDQSILLPYAEFLRLKNNSTGQSGSEKFTPAASISQATYKGTVEENVLRLDAEFTIEVLARANDLLEVHLPFSGASIETATVDGAASSLAPLESEQGLRALMRGEGRRVVKTKLVVPLGSDGATRRLDFRAPRAAASSITISVPEEVILNSEPETLPATVAAANGKFEIKASGGSSDRMFIVYRPRVMATGTAAQSRIAAKETYTLEISQKSAAATIRLDVDVLAGSVSSLPIEIPARVKLLSVSGSFVKDWATAEGGKVNVALAGEVSRPFDLTLKTQIESSETTTTLTVPEIRVPGAVRESGELMIMPDSGLSFWPESSSGLETLSLPNNQNASARGFRFSQPGWKLVLSRKPIPARVRSEGLLLYGVTEDYVTLRSRHTLNISGRGVFEVAFEVPDKYELKEAGPREVVSGYRQQGWHVEVNFQGEQRAAVGVELRFQRTRSMQDGPLAIEPITVIGAEEDAGSVVVAAPVALKVTEASQSGLQATDIGVLQPALQPLLTSQDIVPVLGYRYFAPKFSASTVIEKQRTRLTCETALLASLTPSLMRVTAALNYNVEFSATDQFQLLAPSSLGDDIRFDGANIKEKVRATPKTTSNSKTAADSEPTTWTIRLQQRVLGPYSLTASFDVPLANADSGTSMTVTVPKVRATGVARENGFVGVSRGENFEVNAEKPEGLEMRDVKEMPPTLASAFLGFRYFDPNYRPLKLKLVRHELEPVLGAVIRRMHIDTVLSNQGEATHEVFMDVQNNREQYLELGLPDGIKIWSAFVRGAPVRPTRRESDKKHLIELTKSQTKDDAFRVRLILRETLEGGAFGKRGKIHLEPISPAHGLNIPVLRTTWKLYLPVDFSYVRFGGTMHQQLAGSPPWIEPAAQKFLDDLPATAAGGVAKPAAEPPQKIEGTAYNATETEAEKKARLAGAALEIPIVKEGQQFEFSKLSDLGTIEITYWKKKSLLRVQGAIAILLLGAMLIMMRKGTRIGSGAAIVLVTFIGASLFEGASGRFFATAFAASGVALFIGILNYAVHERRARAGRNKVTPLPPLAPSPPPAPQGDHPASEKAPEAISKAPPEPAPDEIEIESAETESQKSDEDKPNEPPRKGKRPRP